MSKRSAPTTVAGAAERLVEIVSDAGWQVGENGYASFRHFLDYAVARAAACGADSAAQEQALATAFNQHIEPTPFVTAYNLLDEWAGRTFEDVLGPAYMLVAPKGNHLGQFFTPYHICLAMARLAIGEQPSLPHIPYTIHDPAVGSGGNLLAAASLYPVEWHERGYVIFSGVDIDDSCVKMAHLNMRLHHLCSKIVCGDSRRQDFSWQGALVTEPVAWPNVTDGQLLNMSVQGKAQQARQMRQIRNDIRCASGAPVVPTSLH